MWEKIINFITELPPRFWDIAPNAKGSYMIKFDPRKINLDNFSSQWCDVEGQVRTDLSGTVIPANLEEYIITKATAIMSGQRMNEDKEWSEKFRAYNREANDLEQYIYTNSYGRRVGQ